MQCWNLLGYGSSWREWSTSADRYALIRRGMRQPAGEAERAAFRSCWQGDLRQCDTAFEHLEEQGRLRAPLQSHGESQMSLLWIALQEGGEGAWGRLLANQHLPASEALAAVSGLPPEELAGKWRQHMLESRPDPHSDVGSSGLLATFWILAFAGLAMRSTRWRFA